MNLCIVCHERKAEVPDRERRTAWGTKRVCRQCHADRLMGDVNRILRFEAEKRKEASHD